MAIRFLTSGESHGPALLTILEGIPAGLPLPVEVINRDLARRQHGLGSGGRMKIENDKAQILSGVMEGKTTGAPIAITIENTDHTHWHNHPIPPLVIPRPGHADLVGAVKYGYDDLRPALERASARETASRVASGAVCRHLLSQFDITVGGYVQAIGDVEADLTNIPLDDRCLKARESDTGCPDTLSADRMRNLIQQTIQDRDTLGGVIEVIVLNLPPGLGSYVHWDRRLDARLGAAILSIPAIKGVEIGTAFKNSTQRGTQVQDAIYLENHRLIRKTNHAGGLEGGTSTGQPILIRAAMKPIPTTLTPQKSVDISHGKETLTQYERSDICPVPRAIVILEAMVAFVMADALIEKLGGDSLGEMLPRYFNLRDNQLTDINLDNEDHLWWGS